MAATTKRMKDNPITPRSGAATRMAGNALAQRATTPNPANIAVLILTSTSIGHDNHQHK